MNPRKRRRNNRIRRQAKKQVADANRARQPRTRYLRRGPSARSLKAMPSTDMSKATRRKPGESLSDVRKRILTGAS